MTWQQQAFIQQLRHTKSFIDEALAAIIDEGPTALMAETVAKIVRDDAKKLVMLAKEVGKN